MYTVGISNKNVLIPYNDHHAENVNKVSVSKIELGDEDTPSTSPAKTPKSYADVARTKHDETSFSKKQPPQDTEINNKIVPQRRVRFQNQQ